MKSFSVEHKSVGGKQIAVVTFDLPGEKVNKFNREVMEDFQILLHTLQKDTSDVVVMISKKSGIFIAGADIKLIQSAQTEAEAFELARAGQNLLTAWETLPMPTVVAIQGACMGGGCELALASSAIVMSQDATTRIGLPETLLGIIPGMGGCVRLPWKVGIAQGLDLILTGKTLTAEKAYKIGLAEASLPVENFVQEALVWASNHADLLKKKTILAKKPALGGTGGWIGSVLESGLARSMIFSKAKSSVLEKTKGHYPAPLEAIDVISEIGTCYQARFSGQELQEALVREARGFAKMAMTPVSKNLIRLFFMTESVKGAFEKMPVTRAGVLGAGVMGGGIAQLFADKNVPVVMKDISPQALETGIQSALALFKKSLKKRKINERQFQQKLNLLTPTLDVKRLGSAQVIVEAVVEKLEVKQAVLSEIENDVPETTILASNTSSLPITNIQSALKRPQNFCGMHFFNPVHKMPLVEVIRGEKSSDRTVTQVYQLAKQLGKTPVIVKDSPGFLVNRLLMPYLSEAASLLTEGVPILEIDRALLNFGMPMGPIELIDEVGIDVGQKVAGILREAFGDRMNAPQLFNGFIEKKRLGKKTRHGFYRYEGPIDRLQKKFDPEVYSFLGVQPRPQSVAPDVILDRCLLVMINEAARCLEEGIVQSPDDVDLAMIMGTGFPPFLGGLMSYAKHRGYGSCVQRLKELASLYGSRFEPSSALIQLSQGV